MITLECQTSEKGDTTLHKQDTRPRHRLTLAQCLKDLPRWCHETRSECLRQLLEQCSVVGAVGKDQEHMVRAAVSLAEPYEAYQGLHVTDAGYQFDAHEKRRQSQQHVPRALATRRQKRLPRYAVTC